jgi:dTDP-glucose 4,6-dehydratase
MHDGRVVPAFICQALKGEDITVFGNGGQTRSFCYVSDLIAGIYKLLMSDEVDPTNIGNPSEMSVLAFAKTVISMVGSRSAITFKQLPQDDPQVRQPDISKIKRVLGWEPRVSLEDGLRQTIGYFKAQLGMS